MRIVKFFLLINCFVAISCNNEEPFDVLSMQRQMIGIWECTEDSEKSYQITIESSGMMNIDIYNLCDMGKEISINVNLLDKKKILIPSQSREHYQVEGIGTVMKEYKQMTLELHFNDGIHGLVPVTVSCMKK